MVSLSGQGWTWRGAVALVLALCVGVTWSVVVIVIAVTGEPVSGDALTWLAGVGSLLVGGVLGWLVSDRSVRGRHSRRSAPVDELDEREAE